MRTRRRGSRKNSRVTIWVCVAPPGTVYEFYCLFYNAILDAGQGREQLLPRPRTVRVRQLLRGGRRPPDTWEDSDVEEPPEGVAGPDAEGGIVSRKRPASCLEGRLPERPCPRASTAASGSSSKGPELTRPPRPPSPPRDTAAGPEHGLWQGPCNDPLLLHLRALRQEFTVVSQDAPLTPPRHGAEGRILRGMRVLQEGR